jgi:putative transposase
MVCVLEHRSCGLPSRPAPSASIAGRGPKVRRDRRWPCRLCSCCWLRWRGGLPLRCPRPLARRQRRLHRRTRGLGRTQRGSQNRAEAAGLLAREHHRVAMIRRSFLHEVSSQLAKTHSGLAVEDLPVANLIRNKRLARAITDVAWSEFARQLRYKTAWLGGDLVVCERWFPSTKTCSRCSRVAQQMALGTRTFRCDGCGLVMDRDCNAAANLAAWAEAAELDVAQVPDRQAAAGSGHPCPWRGRRWPSLQRW